VPGKQPETAVPDIEGEERRQADEARERHYAQANLGMTDPQNVIGNIRPSPVPPQGFGERVTNIFTGPRIAPSSPRSAPPTGSNVYGMRSRSSSFSAAAPQGSAFTGTAPPNSGMGNTTGIRTPTAPTTPTAATAATAATASTAPTSPFGSGTGASSPF
jgi:hypothetical protein